MRLYAFDYIIRPFTTHTLCIICAVLLNIVLWLDFVCVDDFIFFVAISSRLKASNSDNIQNNWKHCRRNRTQLHIQRVQLEMEMKAWPMENFLHSNGFEITLHCITIYEEGTLKTCAISRELKSFLVIVRWNETK